jgi:hypothetical protein
MLKWLKRIFNIGGDPMKDWLEANMKVQYDNLIAHTARINTIAELAIQNAVNTQDLIQKEAVKHAADRDAMTLENNRYLLDVLLSVYPQEAIGLSTLYKYVGDTLAQNQDFVSSVVQKISEMAKSPSSS